MSTKPNNAPLNLTDKKINAIIAFLHALTDKASLNLRSDVPLSYPVDTRSSSNSRIIRCVFGGGLLSAELEFPQASSPYIPCGSHDWAAAGKLPLPAMRCYGYQNRIL